MSDLLHKHGSRIKSIYLELKGYRYYHSPSEQDKPDKRFIGRKEMKKKLASLITQSETNSGTYLVTGFRGMGKTSLVNQVLSNLFDHSNISSIFKTISGFALALWIATFFSVEIIFSSALFGIFVFLSVLLKGDEKYLVANDNKKRKTIPSTIKKAWKKYLKILKTPYKNRGFSENKKLTFAQDFIRAATILLVASIIIFCCKWGEVYSSKIFSAGNIPVLKHYEYKFSIYLSTFAFYLFVTIFTVSYDNLKTFKKDFNKFKKLSPTQKFFLISIFILISISVILLYHFNSNEIGTTTKIISLFFFIFVLAYFFREKIKPMVHSFVNHSEIVPIRINLGKEKLSEEDILRLITYGLSNSYKRIAKPFSYFRRFLWSVTLGILIYLIGSAFYFYEPTYNLLNDWRTRAHLTEFFPSQSHFIDDFSDSHVISNFIELEDTTITNPNEFFLVSYYLTMYKQNRNFYIDTISAKTILKRTLKKGTSIADTSAQRILQKGTLNEKLSLLRDSINSPILRKLFDSVQTNKLFYYDLDKSFWGKVLPITVSIDQFLLSIYNSFSKTFLKNKKISTTLSSKHSFLSTTLRIDENFRIFPRYDFGFFFFLLLFYLLAIWIIRWRIWGVNHRTILSKLSDLTDNLEAAISIESNRNIIFEQLKTKFSLLPDKRKEFPIKGAREIEISLLEILSDIEAVSSWRMKPKFIFIFDELDKIQPKEFEDNDTDAQKEYTESEWTKRRQDTIGKILTNLKHFFNTAKAKFIFIAGREMYDAALADISDRDALIGSLFHDVIYVHSFYKDPGDVQVSDITTMTERYICQFLLPKREQNNDTDLTLRNYNNYLKKEKGFSDEERIKIILTLHDFIAYLTYRSNGAPKKITKIFEEYLRSYPSEKYDFSSTIINRGDKRSLYLHFGYREQYIFSVGRYLFNPFVIAINKYISNFEDKLLVSTAFLLNHIYKFHKVGFSYKTLELTPEIIAIYKAPELRDFITRLISFLNQTHIRKIISGLYDFKFHSKIEKEIGYISKISEAESAAFNFTLDESLVIKSIFRSKLRKMRAYWGSKRETKNQIDSVAFINANLGDLEFNDNQYFDAILYYKEALIFYEEPNNDRLAPDAIIFWIRTALKLGLSYEMIKNTDEALLVYDRISKKTEEFVDYCYNKDDSNIGPTTRNNAPLLTILRLFYQPLLAKIQLIEKSTIKSLTKVQMHENIKTFRRIVNKYMEPEQNFFLRAEYYNKIGDITFYKNGILFGKPPKNEAEIKPFTKIQVTDREYQYSLPISGYQNYMISLASLIHVGISEKYHYNIRGNYFSKKNPIKSEKLILHYFTSFLFHGIKKKFPLSRRAFHLEAGNCLSDTGDSILILASAEINTKKTGKKELLDLEKLNQILDINLRKNDDSDKILDYNSENHIEDFIRKSKTNEDKSSVAQKNETDDFIKMLKTHNIYEPTKFNYDKTFSYFEDLTKNPTKKRHMKFEEEFKVFSKERKKAINISCSNKKCKNIRDKIIQELSDIKDLQLHFLKIIEESENEKIDSLREEVNSFYDKFDFNRFHIALRYIYISAVFFSKAGDYKEYAFQMTKILHVIRTILTKQTYANEENFSQQDAQKLLDFVKDKIVRKAIRYTYKAYRNYDQTEIKQMLNSLNPTKDEEKKVNAIISTSTSAGEDIKEILLLYKEIELILKKDRLDIKDNFISPYINVSLGTNRLFELNYKSHFNYEVLRQLINDNTLSEADEYLKELLTKDKAKSIISIITNNSSTPHKELEYVILDTLYALFKMQLTIQIFGLSYIHNHSWFASIYRRMAFWGYLYHAYYEVQNSKNQIAISKTLEKLIGIVEINDLKPLSFYEKAQTHCYAIYETHTEGQAYHDMIDNMNYLDDDFNDNSYHFSATIERMVINFGIIDKYIHNLDEIIGKQKKEYYPEKFFQPV